MNEIVYRKLELTNGSVRGNLRALQAAEPSDFSIMHPDARVVCLPQRSLLLFPGFLGLILGTGTLYGALFGLKRQLRGKPAGLRTCIIVVLATDAFVTLSQALTAELGDPSRVLAGVMSGVGFLGGGVILARHGRVPGVTTAAMIWILAAVGAMIGVGQYGAAIAITIIVLIIVAVVDYLEERGILQKKASEPEQDQL